MICNERVQPQHYKGWCRVKQKYGRGFAYTLYARENERWDKQKRCKPPGPHSAPRQGNTDEKMPPAAGKKFLANDAADNRIEPFVLRQQFLAATAALLKKAAGGVIRKAMH